MLAYLTCDNEFHAIIFIIIDILIYSCTDTWLI